MPSGDAAYNKAALPLRRSERPYRGAAISSRTRRRREPGLAAACVEWSHVSAFAFFRSPSAQTGRTRTSAAPAAIADATGAMRGPQVAALFVLLLAIASIPLVSFPLPPLTDYVNHLARMHVIAQAGADPDLARFYEIDWKIIPNLMMDIVVPAMQEVIDVYRAGQIFLIATFAMMLSGALGLHRALFGRWSALPLIAAPLLYNSVFMVGVMDYVFGIGLAMWGLAAWIAIRERGIALRLAVSLAFVLALFFCHLYAVGLYGLGLLAFESLRLTEHPRPLIARLADFVATGLPFIPVGTLLLLSPTMELAAEVQWESDGKIDGIVTVIEVYSDVIALGLTAVVVAAGVLAARRGLMRFHAFGLALLIVGGIVYLAMPRIMFGTYMADQRLPIALAFMLLACISVNLPRRSLRLGFAVLAVVVLSVRVAEIQTNWAELSIGTTSFGDSVKRIERGATVLVAYADEGSGDELADYPLVHAACLAMIERSALVTTAFTVPGKQILQVRDDYRQRVDTADTTPPSIAQLMKVAASVATPPDSHAPAPYWADWQDDYDYIYVLFTDRNAPNPAPDRLLLVHDDARFQLYRVLKGPHMNADRGMTTSQRLETVRH